MTSKMRIFFVGLLGFMLMIACELAAYCLVVWAMGVPAGIVLLFLFMTIRLCRNGEGRRDG